MGVAFWRGAFLCMAYWGKLLIADGLFSVTKVAVFHLSTPEQNIPSMKTRRILLTSCASLIAVSGSAQIVPSAGITHVDSRGSLDDAGDLSFSATAFADGVIGNGAFAPTHTIPNVNNGTYGNASSWIGGSYIGLSWGNAGKTIQSIAFGRDNTGTFSDRSDGVYALQYTTSDLSGLVIPSTGGTAGVVGGARRAAAGGNSGGSGEAWLGNILGMAPSLVATTRDSSSSRQRLSRPASRLLGSILENMFNVQWKLGTMLLIKCTVVYFYFLLIIYR